jgi:aldehyde:ferredoxin oxidoreductase
MATQGGWTGKTLRVNLTTRTVTAEDTLAKYGKFWGGTGMGYKVLWDETTKDTTPFDPECPIIFGWGPLAGTGAPSGGRTAITSLSPQHMKYAVATGHMGGHFSAEAKYAGWDGIIVTGKASGPVYIAVHDDQVDVVDCPELWGQGLYRVTAEIQAAMGGSCQVAAIGQAGQNLVAQSVIMTNYSHSAGGQGANMGAKKCVGIGVVGTGTIKIAGDKRKWKSVIDNTMAIIGSNNQAVVPNTLQAWAEYSPSNARWYAAPGRFWGAANPPVETGICLPQDRQKVGYRCYKADLGANSYPYTVRMDGCHSCPVRCHQMVDVPTAVKWGPETTAQNTCTGWWGRSMHDSSKITGSAKDKELAGLEAYVVGKHMTDDYGVHNNYGTTDRGWTFIFTRNTGAPATPPIAPKAGTVAAADRYVKGADRSKWSFLQLNVPDAEWTKLTAASGLLGLMNAGNLKCIMEMGRIIANQEGELGKFLAGPVEEGITRWVDANGDEMAQWYRDDASVNYWQHGFPKHHSFENGGQAGALTNTGYNRDAQIHSHINIISVGLPNSVLKNLAEIEFARVGWGSGMKDCIDLDLTTPVNEPKARFAKFAICRKELHDSLGLCNWMWPFMVSPLKSRGYRGDLSLEAQLFSLATGQTMTTMQLDREAERFYTLHRALTMRSFDSMDMRMDHDRAPGWGFDYNHGDAVAFTANGSYYVTDEDWENSLDLFYAQWGYDKATGAPTRATLESLDMKFVADELQAAGLLPG